MGTPTYIAPGNSKSHDREPSRAVTDVWLTLVADNDMEMRAPKVPYVLYHARGAHARDSCSHLRTSKSLDSELHLKLGLCEERAN